MTELSNQLIPLILLTVCSVEDLRRRKIRLLYPTIAALLGIGLRIAQGEPAAAAFGCVPGICLLTVSWLSRGSVGAGDGILLTAAGICAGPQVGFFVLFYAMASAALLSTVMILLKKWGRKKAIPFVPFMLGAYIGILFWK